MFAVQTSRYAEPTSLVLGLAALRRQGLTPRGLLFLALDPSGAAHVGAPSDMDAVMRLKVGDKLGLRWPHEGRYYHFDSVHRLRDGFYLFNGDRRLAQPGNVVEVAGLLSDFLKAHAAPNVFFGCTAHQPGSWLVGGNDRVALHDAGYVEVVPVAGGLIARRSMDHRLWMLPWAKLVDTGRVTDWDPVYESDLGNLLMVERRIIDDRLVLTCDRGLCELDLSRLPSVTEIGRARTPPGYGVVGRVGKTGFAVTRGTPQRWGLDDVSPAVLVGVESGSLPHLGEAIERLAAATP